MKKENVIELIGFLLVLLFTYTSVNKFWDMGHFIKDMNNQPFPHWMSGILVWVVPFSELAIATLLVIPKTRFIGLISSTILMGLFTLYTGLVLAHVFEKIPCSCGGVIRKLSWRQHLVFNTFFLGIAVAGWLLTKRLQGEQRANTAPYSSFVHET
jgi:hypothetical protein